MLDNLKIIEDYAFEGCSSLESISIPSTVSYIGYRIFNNCSNLKTITLNWTTEEQLEQDGLAYEGTNNGWLDTCGNLETIYIPYGTMDLYKDHAEKLDIDEKLDLLKEKSLIEVSASAFFNDSAVPGYVYFTSDGLFTTSGLESYSGSLTIPDSYEYLGTTYTITEIGDYAFGACTNLNSITFEENSQLTSIGMAAFQSCSSLSSIEIPDGVENIADSTFAYCSSLTSIEIPINVTSIESDAFYNCAKLSSINIPKNVTSIGSYSFQNCTSLESIEIPSNVCSIEYGAFENCSSLNSITLNWTAKQLDTYKDSIHSDWLNGCSVLAAETGIVYVPYGTSTNYETLVHETWGLTNAQIIEMAKPSSNSNLGLILGLGLGLGIPAVGGAGFGIYYGVKKKKNKK